MQKVLVGALTAAAFMLGATSAFGHAGVHGAHEHVLTTPGATVTIGPDACGNSGLLQPAFQNFHHNIHVGTAADAFNGASNPVAIGFAGCPTA